MNVAIAVEVVESAKEGVHHKSCDDFRSIHSEVVQFEEAPLDPALFEVPPGFKRVERRDSAK